MTKHHNSQKVTMLILAGRKHLGSPPADWVYETRKALVKDLLIKLRQVQYIDKIIISSNDEQALNEYLQTDKTDERIEADYFDLNKTNGKFNFGPWLQEITARYKPPHLFYWGAGASPFITSDLIEGYCSSLMSGKDIFYTNNFFSADWIAFTPAESVLQIEPPLMDNNLPYTLWQKREMRSIYIDPSVEIIGDVDTPSDLLILAVHPKTDFYTKQFLDSLTLNTERVISFSKLLSSRNKIFLAGRVGSALFRYLDTRCYCSFRILSEERGMRSFGRQGQVKSLMGEMIDNMGMDRFFSYIESVSNAAVLDSRVIFAHKGLNLSTSDRFYSDLGIHDKIQDPFAREFTQRVMESPIPILTGGHSLILGGVWSLVWAFGEIPAFY